MKKALLFAARLAVLAPVPFAACRPDAPEGETARATQAARGKRPPPPADVESTRRNATVDIDFTRLNATVRAATLYRLAADPGEFAGKTLRLAGVFLTCVDEVDGTRRFGCLTGGEPGECACCAPGGVLEFTPPPGCVWPQDFPPADGRITLTGRLELDDAAPGRAALRRGLRLRATAIAW